MADANDAGTDSSAAEDTQADPIKNVKAEMDRKFSNITKQLQEQNEALMKTLEQKLAPKPQKREEVEEDLTDLMYSNPTEYHKRIMAKATEAAMSTVQSSMSANQELNVTLNKMMMDYPELNDQGSDLYKKAMEYYGQLSANEKGSSLGVKAVIREAAAELGVVPSSKRRKSGDDDFSFGGNMSNNEGQGNNRKRSDQKDKDVDPLTTEWSKLLGRDTADPKYKERIKKASTRKLQKFE